MEGPWVCVLSANVYACFYFLLITNTTSSQCKLPAHSCVVDCKTIWGRGGGLALVFALTYQGMKILFVVVVDEEPNTCTERGGLGSGIDGLPSF